MPDGEEPVAEPTLESLNAYMRAQSSLLRELATVVAQLTARDRVVGGEGAHGSGSGQRFAGQPTGSGGAAERPDLLELAQSGRVGAKSVSAEDDYLAVQELLQRAESGYEAVRPVSRVPGLFPLSTDLTNEYLKQDDRRLPAQEEYLWMSCFGVHMAALFVALDELLPYVPAASQDFTPYLARARNHAEAIDKAFRFRLAFLRRLNEIKRVHGDQGVLDLQLQVAGVGEDVAAGVGVAAKEAFGSDELGQRTLDLLSSSLSAQTLKSYAGRLSQFAEFCHDSENISPLEATTATVVRYVAWIGERGHIAAKSLQPYLSAINTFFELHNLVPIAKDSLHLTSARRGLMLRQRRLDAAPLRVPLPADVAYRFVTKAELIVSAPYPEYHLDFRALLASVVNFMFFARGLTGVSCRVRDVRVDTYNITLQVYREKGGQEAIAWEIRQRRIPLTWQSDLSTPAWEAGRPPTSLANRRSLQPAQATAAMRRGASENKLASAERKLRERASFELAEDEVEALRTQYAQLDTGQSRLHASVASAARVQTAKEAEFSNWKIRYPSVLEGFESFSAAAHGKRLAVFLDYDGEPG
eukprot:jgi/Tetstr1/458129/TSEL_044621.t1